MLRKSPQKGNIRYMYLLKLNVNTSLGQLVIIEYQPILAVFISTRSWPLKPRRLPVDPEIVGSSPISGKFLYGIFLVSTLVLTG